MRFIDREEEMASLARLKKLSKRKLFVAVIYGLRRVGKTRLLMEFIKDGGLYFFVNKNKTSHDLLLEFQGILKENGILGELETLTSWDKFFEVLVSRMPVISVFDEFQNFSFVSPEVFGILQKTVDLNEDKSGMLVLSGSLIGLVKETFKNEKEPLYGRVKYSRKLEPLSLAACIEIGKELGLSRETLIETYMLLGGYPKYYVTLEDYNANGKDINEILDTLFLGKDAALEDEVSTVLSQEFGNRSGMYYSMLEAIAMGNNTISAIAGYLNVPITSITRQIGELRDYFELIELEMPYSGKRGIYRISHPLMYFWFSMIYKDLSDYSARKPETLKSIKANMNTFFGRRFEALARDMVVGRLGLADAKRQWGKIPAAENGAETYKIDLIGSSEKRTYIFEFKWKEIDYKEALRIMGRLRVKAEHAPSIPRDPKFGIVARKIMNKQKVIDAGYVAYDIEDF
jgi:hypothetical protein